MLSSNSSSGGGFDFSLTRPELDEVGGPAYCPVSPSLLMNSERLPLACGVAPAARSPEKDRRIAIHESGHVLMRWHQHLKYNRERFVCQVTIDGLNGFNGRVTSYDDDLIDDDEETLAYLNGRPKASPRANVERLEQWCADRHLTPLDRSGIAENTLNVDDRIVVLM